ncbi:MAG: hypothetical protein NTZ46_11995 [Verrucomicrobia bacterium]|nr:hypothetical protein [Verrucomicrobiota bacterium]
MDKRDFTILGLRLFAVFAWFESLSYLANGVIGMAFRQTMLNQGNFTAGLGIALFSPTVLYLVLGYVLFRFSEPLAERLLSGLGNAPQIASDTRNFAPIAFGAVGIIGFFMAVHKAFVLVIRWFSILQRSDKMPIDLKDAFLTDLGAILGTAVQLSLSVALIVGANRFSQWWVRRQHFPS